jgi:phage anti-repressor protein
VPPLPNTPTLLAANKLHREIEILRTTSWSAWTRRRTNTYDEYDEEDEGIGAVVQ